MRPAAALAFHLPHAVQAHRRNGNAQVFRKETDAALERGHAAVVRHFAFGKYQHAVSAVHGFADKPETFAETGPLRQGKHIEKRRDEPIAELIRPAAQEKPIARWMRSEEHTSELQSRLHLVCRLLLEK